MDTEQLIKDARARFKHQESKIYLKEKYTNSLTFAHGGGLWTATPELISFLSLAQEQVILQDNYGNPVKVDSVQLLAQCWSKYNTAMSAWLDEYEILKKNR